MHEAQGGKVDVQLGWSKMLCSQQLRISYVLIMPLDVDSLAVGVARNDMMLSAIEDFISVNYTA